MAATVGGLQLCKNDLSARIALLEADLETMKEQPTLRVKAITSDDDESKEEEDSDDKEKKVVTKEEELSWDAAKSNPFRVRVSPVQDRHSPGHRELSGSHTRPL